MRATTPTWAVRTRALSRALTGPQPCHIPPNHSRTCIPADSWPEGQAQLQWETSLRVKLQRAEKNLAAETKLEPCLNHTQSLPCHWTYSVVPANNHLISVIKKKKTQKHSYR